MSKRTNDGSSLDPRLNKRPNLKEQNGEIPTSVGVPASYNTDVSRLAGMLNDCFKAARDESVTMFKLEQARDIFIARDADWKSCNKETGLSWTSYRDHTAKLFSQAQQNLHNHEAKLKKSAATREAATDIFASFLDRAASSMNNFNAAQTAQETTISVLREDLGQVRTENATQREEIDQLRAENTIQVQKTTALKESLQKVHTLTQDFTARDGNEEKARIADAMKKVNTILHDLSEKHNELEVLVARNKGRLIGIENDLGNLRAQIHVFEKSPTDPTVSSQRLLTIEEDLLKLNSDLTLKLEEIPSWGERLNKDIRDINRLIATSDVKYGNLKAEHVSRDHQQDSSIADLGKRILLLENDSSQIKRSNERVVSLDKEVNTLKQIAAKLDIDTARISNCLSSLQQNSGIPEVKKGKEKVENLAHLVERVNRLETRSPQVERTPEGLQEDSNNIQVLGQASSSHDASLSPRDRDGFDAKTQREIARLSGEMKRCQEGCVNRHKKDRNTVDSCKIFLDEYGPTIQRLSDLPAESPKAEIQALVQSLQSLRQEMQTRIQDLEKQSETIRELQSILQDRYDNLTTEELAKPIQEQIRRLDHAHGIRLNDRLLAVETYLSGPPTAQAANGTSTR